MKLAILVSHPIQYLVPLYRHLSEDPDIDVTVYFCTDMGVTKAAHDEQFGVAIKWGIPLLEGYTHRFLRNRARRPRLGTHFSGVVNWDIISILRKERPDAILIPQSTVLYRSDREEVFVAGADNRAALREIELGLSLGEQIEIRKGLAVGDQLIVTGGQYLKPGDKILISAFVQAEAK